MCYLVVRSEVVDLLPEHTRPKVFTDELHDVQLVFEARRVLRHSCREKLRPSTLQSAADLILMLGLGLSISHLDVFCYCDRHKRRN